MHALSSRATRAPAALGARSTPSCLVGPSPLLLLAPAPAAGARHHRRDLPGRVRSASREEALRSLEQFSAGVAAATATAASPSASPPPAAPADDAAAGGLRALTADTFWPFLREEAGDSLVVVDFYTQWCGPCKLIYPKLVALADALAPRGVLFAKADCNAEFKAVGKALNIRVAPTFHLYRRGVKVAEMTGAHVDRLQALVEEQLGGGAAADGTAAAAV
jgi:thioredoxin 1